MQRRNRYIRQKLAHVRRTNFVIRIIAGGSAERRNLLLFRSKVPHYIGSNLNTTNSTYLTVMSLYAPSTSSEATSAASNGQALRITWEGNQFSLQPTMRTYISSLINRCAYEMSTENPPYYPYHAHLMCVPHGPRSSSTLFNLVSLTFTIAGLAYPQLRSTRKPQRRHKSLYFQNLGPKICYWVRRELSGTHLCGAFLLHLPLL